MTAGPQLCTGFGCAIFTACKALVVNGWYAILYGLTDYNRPLEVDSSANYFLHTPSAFHKRSLQQIQQFVQGEFQKARVASTATEKLMWTGFEQGRLTCQQEGPLKRKGKIRFHVWPDHLIVEEMENLWTEGCRATVKISSV